MLIAVALCWSMSVPAAWAGVSVAAAEETADAVARVKGKLELDPADAAALEELAGLCGKQGDADGQVCNLVLALDAWEKTEFDDPKVREETLKRVGGALASADKEISELKEARDAYVKDLAWAMQLYAVNQKKYRNGLEVAARILRYRPSHAAAKKTVDDILKVGDASLKGEATRLLSLGDLARPRAFLEGWAKEHRQWKKAGKIVTDGYEVRSNVGYDELSYTARGLDQISAFYAEFYGTDRKQQIGKTTVTLTKTRDEWVELSALPELTDNQGVMAFIQTEFPEEKNGKPAMTFRMFAYDPRDVGRPLESLWPILWHEASHQYMQLAVGAHRVPLWLNEGMASYCEGALVSPEGEVSIGGPAWDRLRNATELLSTGAEKLEDTLKATGFLRGEQYSLAWAVCYYLRHLHTPDGQRMPRDLLTKAVAQCAGRDVEGYALFQKAVLEPLKLDYAAFESAWSDAIQELNERENDPVECARLHLERGAAALAAKDLEATAEAARDAALRTPDDPKPLLLQAKVARARSTAAKDKDARLKDEALVLAREAHRKALVAGDAATEKEAAELAKSLDPAGFQKIADAERTYRRKLERLVQERVTAKKPRSALAIVGRYLDDVLGDRRQQTLAAELRAKDVLALERVVRLFDGQSLLGLSASEQHFRVEEGALVARSVRPQKPEDVAGWPRAPLFVEALLAPRFRLEGEVELADADTQLILTFAQPRQTAARGFAVRPHPPAGFKSSPFRFPPFDELLTGHHAALIEGFIPQLQRFDFRLQDASSVERAITPGRWIPFVMSREELGVLKLSLDGEEVNTVEVDAHADGAKLGITIWGGRAKLRNLRAIELDRL